MMQGACPARNPRNPVDIYIRSWMQPKVVNYHPLGGCTGAAHEEVLHTGASLACCMHNAQEKGLLITNLQRSRSSGACSQRAASLKTQRSCKRRFASRWRTASKPGSCMYVRLRDLRTTRRESSVLVVCGRLAWLTLRFIAAAFCLSWLPAGTYSTVHAGRLYIASEGGGITSFGGWRLRSACACCPSHTLVGSRGGLQVLGTLHGRLLCISTAHFCSNRCKGGGAWRCVLGP